MTKEEAKANLTRLQKQFQIDLAKMLAMYPNKELARLTGINAANLSRYKTHPPGIIAMQKFYGGLAGIINNPFKQTNLNMEDNKDQKESKENQGNQEGSKEQKDSNGNKTNTDYDHDDTQNKTEEPGPIPLYDDSKEGRTNELIANLRTANAHHRNVENKMLDSTDKLFTLPHKWLGSLDKMVEAHTLAIQKDLVNAETQKMFTAAFLKKFGGEE